jgi:hypothetical protein
MNENGELTVSGVENMDSIESGSFITQCKILNERTIVIITKSASEDDVSFKSELQLLEKGDDVEDFFVISNSNWTVKNSQRFNEAITCLQYQTAQLWMGFDNGTACIANLSAWAFKFSGHETPKDPPKSLKSLAQDSEFFDFEEKNENMHGGFDDLFGDTMDVFSEVEKSAEQRESLKKFPPCIQIAISPCQTTLISLHRHNHGSWSLRTQSFFDASDLIPFLARKSIIGILNHDSMNALASEIQYFSKISSIDDFKEKILELVYEALSEKLRNDFPWHSNVCVIQQRLLSFQMLIYRESDPIQFLIASSVIQLRFIQDYFCAKFLDPFTFSEMICMILSMIKLGRYFNFFARKFILKSRRI